MVSRELAYDRKYVYGSAISLCLQVGIACRCHAPPQQPLFGCISCGGSRSSSEIDKRNIGIAAMTNSVKEGERGAWVGGCSWCTATWQRRMRMSQGKREGEVATAAARASRQTFKYKTKIVADVVGSVWHDVRACQWKMYASESRGSGKGRGRGVAVVGGSMFN